MITGIGVDLVDIRRIDRMIMRFGDQFLDRYFTPDEKNFCFLRSRSPESFAKMFAIKEATFKAISLKNRSIFLKDIEVLHDDSGKPSVVLHGEALSQTKLISGKSVSIEVSVTDEIPYCCAFVVIQRF